MTQQIEPTLLSTASLSLVRAKNLLINGDMRIDQRNGGSSITCTSSSVFAVDRFRSGMSGANGTAQRVACSLTGFPYMLRLTGTSSTTTAWVGQRIESHNCAPLVGKKLTVQFRAASSNVTSIAVALKHATAADNFTSTTTIQSSNVTITSTLTYYTVSFTTALPAGAVNGLYIELSTNTNLGTGTFEVTGAQLEAGSTATPFEYRPIGHEAMLCQRYYYKANAYPLGVTLNVSDGYASIVHFPVQMRANPTLESGAAFTVGSGSAGTVELSTVNGEAALLRNSAANWTANQSLSVVAGFSAEIP